MKMRKAIVSIPLLVAVLLVGCRKEAAGPGTAQPEGTSAGNDQTGAEATGEGTLNAPDGERSSSGAADLSTQGGTRSQRPPMGRITGHQTAESPGSEPSEGGPAARQVRKTLTLPEGKKIRVQLDTALSSVSSKVGDTFTATVSKPVHLQEGTLVALPKGTKVEGTVTDVEAAKRVKGTAKLVLKFDTLILTDGTRVPITASLTSEAESTKKRDAATIAGGAAAGALLGKIIGHDGKDALIGAVAGGAIGTGVVLGTKGKEVELAAGTELSLQLQDAVNVPQT